MRLLRVIPSMNPRHGGPGEGVRQITPVLARRGHRTEVVSVDEPDADWLEAHDFPVHAVGPGRTAWGYAPDLRPWLRNHVDRFDRVIVHGLWQYVSYAAWRVLRDRRVPYYVFPHGMLDPWFKRTFPLKHLKKWLFWPWAEYRLLRDARAVLFTTEEERRLARESFWLYDCEERVVGYGTGGPPDEEGGSERNEFRHGRPALGDGRMILFLGRIHPKKGCDLLVDAFGAVFGEDPDWHLVVAGPDQVGWRSELEERAERAGVADRITWTGMVEGTRKWDAVRAADVLALPSHQENFGIVVAEALSCGVPVLTTRGVNTWREVEEAGAGLVGEDTRAGVRDLLARWKELSADRRARMRERALELYRDRFEMGRFADRFVEALDRSPHVAEHARQTA